MESKLQVVLKDIEQVYPGLREVALTVLASAATTRLKRDLPVTVILVGGPSSGKTTMLSILYGGQSTQKALKEQVLRLDDLTPNSFVSHMAGRSQEDLGKVDLLAKFPGKVVVVKDLSAFFSGPQDALQQKLARFTNVLDGQGYLSASGAHGVRGYDQPTVFTLLGAITPKLLTGKIMAAANAIGPRFLFMEMPSRVQAEEWYKNIEKREVLQKEALGKASQFVAELFDRHPATSVEAAHFVKTEAVERYLGSLAELAVKARSKVEIDPDEGVPVISVESPERVLNYLKQVTHGVALCHGRYAVEIGDLRVALSLAIGSALARYRAILGLAFRVGWPISVHDAEVAMAVRSWETAQTHLEALVGLGIMTKQNRDSKAVYELVPELCEIRTAVSGVNPDEPPVKPSDPLVNRIVEPRDQQFEFSSPQA